MEEVMEEVLEEAAPQAREGELAGLVRALAEEVGGAVRERRLARAQLSAGRRWLQQAFAWESDASLPWQVGVRLLREGEALLGLGLGRQGRVEFAWWMFHRLMRRWPITVPCLHRVGVDRAVTAAEAMVDVRLDRLDAIFALLKIDPTFANREVKTRQINPMSAVGREIVKKQGST